MRHTELWARLEHALGTGYYATWADQFVIGDLGGRTVRQALDAGTEPQQVWVAAWRALELPDTER